MSRAPSPQGLALPGPVSARHMGIDPIADSGKDHTETWRSTKRLGRIAFGNVRRMGPETLACPEAHDWRLVVDFPFDESGFGPQDDERVVESFREQGDGSWTLVWLPSFFSKSMQNMLGDLVKLEHILESSSTRRQYISHLSVENQSRAANDLEKIHNNWRREKNNLLFSTCFS